MVSKKEKSKKNLVCYIGQSLPGLAIFSVFNQGSYPLTVKKLIETYPNIAHLMVPVSKLQQARKDSRTQGHILNHYLKHLLDKEE